MFLLTLLNNGMIRADVQLHLVTIETGKSGKRQLNT